MAPRAVLTSHEPFFILLMSSLLKRPLVFSCSGQLMVTTSHCETMSSSDSTRRAVIALAAFSGRGA